MLDVLKKLNVLNTKEGAFGNRVNNLPEANISVNIPIPNDAKTVPSIFPTPPRTTTMKHGTIYSCPTSGPTDPRSETATPATPARPEPIPNVIVSTFFVDIPKHSDIDLFWVTALILIPHSVRFKK